MSWTLGIYECHDASVALVSDDGLIHLPLERVTRRRHDTGRVDEIIPLACQQAGIALADIDLVAVAGPSLRYESEWPSLMALGRHEFVLPDGTVRPAITVPHHHAHAVYAQMTAPWWPDATVTIDGGGDVVAGETVSVSLWGSGEAPIIPEERSLGLAWNALAERLWPDRHGTHTAGKLMALAGLAAERFPFDRAVHHEARQLQAALTDQLQRLVIAALHGRRGRVALAGGVALNGIAVRALLDAHVVADVHVPPAVSDEGLSIGAALVARLESGLGTWREPPSAFCGYVEPDLLGAPSPEDVADALAAGRVLGVARGRAESGPRALGHRSLLAAPTQVALRDRVNVQKGREPWRPLAPAVLASAAAEWFDIADPAPFAFMTVIARVRPERRERIAGVVHDDGTARVQCVPDGSWFGDVLAALGDRTGVPMVLNTSLNVAGEAMPNTAAQARDTAERLGVDGLVLGETLTWRS